VREKKKSCREKYCSKQNKKKILNEMNKWEKNESFSVLSDETDEEVKWGREISLHKSERGKKHSQVQFTLSVW
jgi:hypothetical protein